MSQAINEVNGSAAQPAEKQAWTTPAIETYDVAEFTLAVTGTRGIDNGANIS